MAKWNSKPQLAAGQLADTDLVPLSDSSAAVGSRDATTALGALRTYLGSGITVGVTQASHGLSVGDPIRHTGSAYALATADTAANAEAIGVVTQVDGDDFAYQTAGVVSTLSGLTAGELYFLADDGTLSMTSGSIMRPVLIATSTTAAVLILSLGGTAWGSITGSISNQADLQLTLSTVAVNAQTGTSYTLVLADAGKLVTLANAGTVTVTVPENGDEAIPVDSVIALQQLGAGQVAIVGDTGVTINGVTPGDETLTNAQYVSTGVLRKTGTNTWVLSGAVA